MVEHVSYLLQTFRPKGRGLEPAGVTECRDEPEAWRRAERALEVGRVVGALILRQESDPSAGEYAEPEVLKTFGRVPDPLSDD